MKRKVVAFVVIWVILIGPLPALAQDKLSAAVAANFISAFKELAARFEAKTKTKVEGTFSSTGALYSQIVNGAPYDIFLSADETRPAVLFRDGIADKPFVYARGRVILWSADENFCKGPSWQDALKYRKIKKIAIANPLTAPYGAAAQTALRKAGLWDTLQDKLVIAQNIAQSFQYANTLAVDACFCALSVTAAPEGKRGCYFPVSEAPETVQSACLLKKSKNRAAAQQFSAFLNSPEGTEVRMKYGYH
ncbi:MAG: molybdate ABC transporter substrate-binding protein [Syntrophales bacterium]|nr:molybdate ABC transporter substrate-binding protein [Syntrophales bacterium]